MHPVLVLNGPTASGKSALAVEVALELKERGIAAEIINADAMLVYRGMDIGTAKPTMDERQGVPHHLLDFLEVTQTATVADFQSLARSAIQELRARDVVPVVVGGSALYVHAILDAFEFPATDERVRARLEAELAEIGPDAMHSRLAALAPDTAAGILPGNARRTVRALEVIELTGSYSSQLPQWSYAVDHVRQFGLELERPILDARIATRVDAMWEAGLVAEVRRLEARGLRQGVTAWRALGYRQILSFLDGEITEAEAREKTVFGTRRFARKQLSWFRRDPRVEWLAAGDLGNAARIGLAAVPGRS